MTSSDVATVFQDIAIASIILVTIFGLAYSLGWFRWGRAYRRPEFDVDQTVNYLQLVQTQAEQYGQNAKVKCRVCDGTGFADGEVCWCCRGAGFERRV